MTVVINGTTGIDTGTGSLISADSTTPTYLDLFEDTDNGSNYVRLIAPTSVASNRTITLPDGTGTVAVNGVNGVLVSGTSQTAPFASPNTSCDFTGIPSWAKRITVMFDGVSKSGTSNFLVQLGDSGGIENTGYIGNAIGTFTGPTVININSTAGFPTAGDASAASVIYGAITFNLIDASTNNWVAAGVIALGNAGYNTTIAGRKALSGTLDRVRVTTVNGTDTFDAGTINILYE